MTLHQGSAPCIRARAPVRVSFGGGGTDLAAYYSRFDGLVLSAALAHYCWVTARQPADGGIHLYSAEYQIEEHFPSSAVPTVEGTLQLPKAVIEYFADRGIRHHGVELFLSSDVPPGTGLGSSSAMTVALIRALAQYLSTPLTAAETAEMASRIEIERLNMPIGKQDQYASAFGGINTISFRRGGVDVYPLSLSLDVQRALAGRLLLFSTGQSRYSGQILKQQRTDSVERETVTTALHHLKSLAEDMRLALVHGNLDAFGYLLHEAWQHKKQLSSKISSTAIDSWYESARHAGALGGKITGAGGGGFLMFYCPPERQEAVRAVMGRSHLQEWPFTFDLDGAMAWVENAPCREGYAAEMPVPAGVSRAEQQHGNDTDG